MADPKHKYPNGYEPKPEEYFDILLEATRIAVQDQEHPWASYHFIHDTASAYFKISFPEEQTLEILKNDPDCQKALLHHNEEFRFRDALPQPLTIPTLVNIQFSYALDIYVASIDDIEALFHVLQKHQEDPQVAQIIQELQFSVNEQPYDDSHGSGVHANTIDQWCIPCQDYHNTPDECPEKR
jgi:hypothetical protein